MALYAFDGTWNEDDPNPTGDTNVVKFTEAYTRGVEYIEGVGTRHGVVGKIFGGLAGAGGKKRIREMYDELCENWKNGDTRIDIIGFSRGAALALHFANVISERGVQLSDTEVVKPRIRFLGLWDVVASFGMPIDAIFPFHETNVGYKLTAPDNVDRCFHAMALDECRQAFVVTRLNVGNTRDNIDEVWFRGVHSDVGGGNKNTQLSNISLKWMLERAADCGLPIDASSISELDGTMDRTVPLGENTDLIKNPKRKTYSSDCFHPSSQADTLSPGESREFSVRARERYSWSAVRLVEGGQYTFDVPEGQQWEDGSIKCGPDGWRTEDQEMSMPIAWIVKFTERFRRFPEANWFEIIGAARRTDGRLFRIGDGSKLEAPYVSPVDAELYAFANDIKSKYGNNEGSVKVIVTRVA